MRNVASLHTFYVRVMLQSFWPVLYVCSVVFLHKNGLEFSAMLPSALLGPCLLWNKNSDRLFCLSCPIAWHWQVILYSTLKSLLPCYSSFTVPAKLEVTFDFVSSSKTAEMLCWSFNCALMFDVELIKICTAIFPLFLDLPAIPSLIGKTKCFHTGDLKNGEGLASVGCSKLHFIAAILRMLQPCSQRLC